MQLDNSEFEMIKNLSPLKSIVDLSVLGDRLSTEEKFKEEVQKVVGDERLPLFFPSMLDFFKAIPQGYDAAKKLRDTELNLPTKLLNSDSYIDKPELRGPVEEIILMYEKERVRQGLARKFVIGIDWSQSFLKRFDAIHNLPITELEFIEEMDELHKKNHDDFVRQGLVGKKVS